MPIHQFVKLAAQVMNVDAIFLSIVANGAYYVAAVAGLTDLQIIHKLMPFVATGDQPVFIENLHEPHPIADIAVAALAGMPLYRSGVLVGFLGVAHGMPIAWNEAHQDQLSNLAVIGADLLSLHSITDYFLPSMGRGIGDEDRGEERLRENGLTDEQRLILKRLERELMETLDINVVYAFIMDAAWRATRAENGYLALISAQETTEIVHVLGDHYRRRLVVAKDVLNKPDQFLNQWIVSQKQAQIIPDIHRLLISFLPTPNDRNPYAVFFAPHTSAAMFLPITYRGKIIGILSLETQHAKNFTPSSLEFLKLLMDRVGLAIDNAHTHQTVQDQLVELQRLYEQVKGLERMKSTLLDLAAHDLRNQISVVNTNIGLAQRIDELSEERRSHFLTQALQASKNAAHILDDLMVLQRIEKGGKDSTFQLLDFNAVIKSVVTQQSPRAEARKQAIIANLNSRPLMILGEPALLRQALANLVDNAMKYSPEGGTIDVSSMTEGDDAMITICDNGYGIAPADAVHVFDAFYRSPDAVKRGISGTGLGLHIVQQIVEQHGGTISVQSKTSDIEPGTTFKIVLPMTSKLFAI